VPAVEPKVLTLTQRGGMVLIGVGFLSSLCVYFGHDWFHDTLLPTLGIGAAAGDALGGFFIVVVAYFAQRLASLAIFDDMQFGLLRLTQQLQQSNVALQTEVDELDQLASLDRLTGCWNRRGLEAVIRSEIDRVARHDQSLSLLMVDIDHFKRVNDQHGHTVGDHVLVETAGLLRAALRLSDSLTRWGGEEFIVLCPNTSLTTAVALAERLREKISQAPIDTVGSITASFGVAECLVGEEWTQWLDRADAALYRAKHKGRDQVQFAPETPVRTAMADPLEHKLVHLSWHPTYECGHAEIDRDHRALFTIANELLNAVVAGKPAEELEAIIEILLREVTRHFLYEESLLSSMGYADVEGHAMIHRQLLGKATQLVDAFKSGNVESGPFFQFLVYDVVARHMLGADREFFPIFQPAAKGPDETAAAQEPA
jgi:diguanylate cyclase (GGDEF)-like protein/hemerythrin-like metal-binding protein